MMRLMFLPAALARDITLFWWDAALAAIDSAVCRTAGHDAHWDRSTTGLVRRCDRCGVSTGFYPDVRSVESAAE